MIRDAITNKFLVTGSIMMECPACGRKHIVETRSQIIDALYNHRHIVYTEEYCYCPDKHEEFWAPSQAVRNARALMRAREKGAV